MPIEIRVPAFGESIFEATVGAWLKREGDAVTAGETVVELETDKINVAVTSPANGMIEKLAHVQGDTVRPGDLLATVSDIGALPASRASRPAAAGSPQSAPSKAGDATTASAAATGPDATPVARNLAESRGIDLAVVKGSGPGGRITREDVEAFVPLAGPAALTKPTSPSAASQVTATGQREERVKLSRRQLTMAQRLVEVSHQAVMTTTFNEVDMSGIAELRRRYREEFKARHSVDLGLMSFFIKATVAGLQAHPVMNAELQREELVYKRYYDIGIAVAADEGLLVPVVRDADRKSFSEIEKDVASLAGKARERKLTLDELRGGTFTLTNGGIFGSLMSTPVLNPPQVGILGMHRILERPVALGGQVVIRPMMYLAVTYDHRVVEGSDAVRFLVRVKQLLEDPGRLLVHA